MSERQEARAADGLDAGPIARDRAASGSPAANRGLVLAFRGKPSRRAAARDRRRRHRRPRCCIWEAVARAGLVNPLFLPGADRRGRSHCWWMIAEQDLLWHAGISTLRVWLAFIARGGHGDPDRHADEQLPHRRRGARADHRLHPLSAGAGAGAPVDHLVRRRREHEDLPALARHLLPARAAGRRRHAPRAARIFRDRLHARRQARASS